MALLICAVLLLAGLGVLIHGAVQQRLRQQRVVQRLEGEKTGPGKISVWMRALGSSKFGQRSVSMDNETQVLLNRVGWRTASQRSLFAAFQVGTCRWCMAGVMLVAQTDLSQFRLFDDRPAARLGRWAI
jgi:tight adherence protein C